MSGAAPFLIAGSTILSTVGAIQSANAQEAAEKRNQQIALRNQELARQDAIRARQTADIASEDLARDNRRQLADLRANLGASGVEFSGSPIDVLADTSIEMALDQRRTSYEGAVRARDGEIEANNYGEEAAAAKLRAKNARTSGYVSAGTALLTGGTKAYNSFDKRGYFDKG